MRQFNAAPGWPDPPTARWKPPKRWRPAESWPPAPADWPFWVNEAGKPVRGPIGRYGGPRRTKVAAFAAVPLALIAAVLFNPFDGGDNPVGTLHIGSSEPTPVPTSAPTTDTTRPPASPPASPGATAPTSEPSTATTPNQTPSPAARTTPTPAASPTTPSATSQPTPEPTEPSPTASRTTPTVVPVTTAAVVFQNCAEARAAGKAPLRRGDPGYSEALDRNGDGVACDRGNS